MNALVTRRSLLLAAAGVALAGGGFGLVHLGPPGEGLRVLTAREVRVVEALARVLFPPGIFPVHGGDGGTAPQVDLLLADIFPPHVVPPFRYVLRAIQMGTLIARGRHFHELSPAEAQEVVSIWAGDDPLPRRLASDSIKLVLGTAFFRRPEVKAAIGFRAECLAPFVPPAPAIELGAGAELPAPRSRHEPRAVAMSNGVRFRNGAIVGDGDEEQDDARRGYADYGSIERWEADVCVVGAGAGGAAAALAMAERGLSVVVVEAGSHWHPQQFEQDAAWAYRHIYVDQGARSAVGNAVIPVPGGRGVGGSTLINSAICFRTPLPVMKQWAEEFGCHRLGPDTLPEKLDRVWEILRVVVNPVAFQQNNNLIFKKGADALGMKGKWLSRSAPGCVGCGVCYMGCPTGGKTSVDRTFLFQARETGNCRIHADCRVSGVQRDGDRVIAITGQTVDPATLQPGGSFEVRARSFLFSAGPVGTPKLLLANGLADSSRCGAWLHLHPATGLLGRFEQEIRPWRGVTQGYYVDRWQEGYLLQTYTASPDQTYTGMPYSLGADLLAAIADLRHMAMAGPLVHDEDSTGGVSLTGMTYFLGDGDRRKLLAGMRATAEVFFAAGAQEVYPGIVGGRPIRSPADIGEVISLDEAARRIYLYASHPMGSCRMGADPTASCVDPDGRVWGFGNLYVADASVFPTSLGVNPQVSTMAVGLTVGEQAIATAG